MKELLACLITIAFLSTPASAGRLNPYGYWVHDNPEAPYEGLVELRVSEQGNVHIDYLRQGTRAMADGKLDGSRFEATGKITRGDCRGQEIKVHGLWHADYYQIETEGSKCLKDRYYPYRRGGDQQ